MANRREADIADRDAHRRVYIIEIASKWYPVVAPNIAAGARCFYVGETGRDVAERFKEHRLGAIPSRKKKRAARVFARIRVANEEQPLKRGEDVTLRRRMFDDLDPVATHEEADALEAQVIDDLRSEGHVVYPERFGSVPFYK